MVRHGAAGRRDGSCSTTAVLTASSWRMCSIVASSARVPFVASSSTAFTVFSKEVTFVTITCGWEKDSQVKTRESSGLVWAPVPPSCFGAKQPCPHTPLTTPHPVLPPMPPLHAVLHFLRALSRPLALTVPQLSSCPQTGREAPLLFLQLPLPHPPLPITTQLRPWQSSSAGRQQGHRQLCQQLPWWHRSGLQVPWPHPSQH